uniref:Uncharacterized protein n=1 Tax=Arundo donax TaxID=35708 RepID=A0A0A8ZIW1_ARUDO
MIISCNRTYVCELNTFEQIGENPGLCSCISMSKTRPCVATC